MAASTGDTGHGTDVKEGDPVVAADGERVGKVVEVHPTSLVVREGLLFHTDYYLPLTAVAGYDGETVRLRLTKAEARTTSQATETDPAATDEAAVGGLGHDEVAPTTTHAAPFDHRLVGEVAHDDADGGLRVPVYVEELAPVTHEAQIGAVQIAKEVVTEEQTLAVPVVEERVVVQRRRVDREAADGPVFEEGELTVPLRGEVVSLGTEVRVAEEVEVAREAVERTERVVGTVRREEVRVTEDHDPRPLTATRQTGVAERVEPAPVVSKTDSRAPRGERRRKRKRR